MNIVLASYVLYAVFVEKGVDSPPPRPVIKDKSDGELIEEIGGSHEIQVKKEDNKGEKKSDNSDNKKSNNNTNSLSKNKRKKKGKSN